MYLRILVVLVSIQLYVSCIVQVKKGEEYSKNSSASFSSSSALLTNPLTPLSSTSLESSMDQPISSSWYSYPDLSSSYGFIGTPYPISSALLSSSEYGTLSSIALSSSYYDISSNTVPSSNQTISSNSIESSQQVISSNTLSSSALPSSSSVSSSSTIPFVPLDSGAFVDTRDHEEYRWVQIGQQKWMSNNLRFFPSLNLVPEDSSDIPEVRTNPEFYIYEFFPDSMITDSANSAHARATESYQKCGTLYTWYTAMMDAEGSESIPSGVTGICPAGWHLPSSDEWALLIKYIELHYPGGHPITKLKTTQGWEYNGTDLVGFHGEKCGNANYGSLGGTDDNAFFDSGTWSTNFWSTTPTAYGDEPVSIQWFLRNDVNSGMYYYIGGKYSPKHVRCIED